MAAFRIDETFYMGKLDLIVMTGVIVDPPVQPGMFLEVPKALAGPGKVPIAGVEFVQFATGEKLAITVHMDAFASAPTLEFSALHGKTLEVSG